MPHRSFRPSALATVRVCFLRLQLLAKPHLSAIMAPSILKKRKLEDALRDKTLNPSKKLRKQTHYSSPSPSTSSAGEVSAPGNLADSDIDGSPSLAQEPSPSPKSTSSPALSNSDTESNSESSSDEDSHDEASSNPNLVKRKTRKANDPAAFANSIAKILGSKLSASKRADPVLARSATAREANESISNSRLEAKARHKLREDRKKDLERGRVKDVLLGTDAPQVIAGGSLEKEGGGARQGLSVGEMQEQEKRLRKTAQRGVVKLFNAVKAAQVKGVDAARNAKGGGRDRKQERVGEMSKQGFLELVAGGGATGKSRVMGAGIEEA